LWFVVVVCEKMGKNTFLKLVPRLVEPSASELNERERIKKEKERKNKYVLKSFFEVVSQTFFLVIFNDFFFTLIK